MSTPQRRDREPTSPPPRPPSTPPLPPGCAGRKPTRTIFVPPPPIEVGFEGLRLNTPCGNVTADAVIRTAARILLLMARDVGEEFAHETLIRDEKTGFIFKASAVITGGSVTYKLTKT